jgi:hypothetical protein
MRKLRAQVPSVRSCTVENQWNMPPNPQNLKPFKKGDPRINRNGRPKSFDALRKLMQEQAGEIALDGNGQPILDKNGRPRTNAELFVEAWMKDRKQRKAFAEFAWGKPKEELDITSGGKTIRVVLKDEDGS